MLGANLKTLRKNKGFSQEQLATRLNVVRQTVSKWEQGLSVPDSEMLVKISEILGASVGELLSVEIAPEKAPALEAVARELEKLNEQLAARQARRQAFFRKAAAAAAVFLLVLFLAAVFPQWNVLFYKFGQNLYEWLH